MRKGIVASALAVAALSGTLTACGGDDSSSSTSSTSPAPAASGTGGGGEAQSKDTVVIKTFEFTPKTLTVKAGTTVTFRNNDAILHTVTSGTRKGENKDTPDGTFDIELKDAGTTGTEKFDTPGTYTYYCKVHPGPGMTGKIVVE